MTFGAFISTRRKEAKLNLRDTAKHLGISNGYLCDIEQGRRPAPEGAFVERISSFLELDKQEHEMLLDLAADSRQTVPADLPDYIRQHDIVRAALRVAKEVDATDEEWKAFIYLQSFAPDMDLQEFEERVCCVMENRMLVDVIDRALLRLKRYPDRGELYYEILTKQFIHRFNSTEKELLDELNMERSVFYDRKREAIFLLSLCLFGYAVPELQEELEMPRLYPD